LKNKVKTDQFHIMHAILNKYS